MKLWYKGAVSGTVFETNLGAASAQNLFEVINNGEGGTTWNNSSLQHQVSHNVIRCKKQGIYKIVFPSAANYPTPGDIASWPSNYTITVRAYSDDTSGKYGVYYRSDPMLENGYLFEIDRQSNSFYIREVLGGTHLATPLQQRSFASVSGFNEALTTEMVIRVNGTLQEVVVKQNGVEYSVFSYTDARPEGSPGYHPTGVCGLYGQKVSGGGSREVQFYYLKVVAD